MFLTEASLKKLRAISRKTGNSVASMVRIAIDDFLAKLEKDRAR
jgi:hypothetical protein